jgi:SNF2 family DNA or RNA helicase
MLTIGKHVLCDLEAIELMIGPPEVIRGIKDFRPYQTWMVDLIMRKKAVYLGVDMGMGKTTVCLLAIRRLLDAQRISKVLIVAPLEVAKNTWPGEIAVWRFSRSLRYSVIVGDAEQRKRALEKDVPIHIINRENLVWLYKTLGPKRWDYDALIYDEASRLKQGRKRTQLKKKKGGKRPSGRNLSEFGVLSRMRYAFKKVVELSGTPSPNGLHDLWGPIYILDKGKRLGESKTAFEQRWFDVSPYDYSVTPLPHAEGEIMGAISDVFFSLRSEDYLDLPPLVISDVKVKLDQISMKRYRFFERECAFTDWDVEAVNRGVLTNKLLQMANGSVYETDKTEKEIHDLKIDALDRIVSEANGKPMLVAYSFKFDLRRLRKKYPRARVYGEGDNDLRDWNAGKIQMLLVHPMSAGHGLNFQHGGNIAVWFGLTWSLELYRQFVKRLHRSGQKAERVFMYRIIAENTVDEDVLSVLDDKGATQDRITERVRVRLSKIREEEKCRQSRS